MAGLSPGLEAAATAPAVRLPGRFRDAELPLRWLLIPAGLLVLYLAFPVLRLLWSGAPGLAGALLDPAVRQSLLVTFVTAAAATAIGLVLAAPLGYVLARRRFRGQRAVRALLDLPLVIPHPVVGIALLLVFAREALAGRGLAWFHVHMVGTLAGITAAMLFVACPYLIHACRDGFLAVDPRYEQLARTLGHRPGGVFWRVTLPLARGPIVSGAVMMFARAISEFGALIILAYNPRVISILIYDRFSTYGLAAALPIAALALLAGFAILWALSALEPRRQS
ncbi:MAG: ABC transporter permease subunit [Terriglobales bacterium]